MKAIRSNILVRNDMNEKSLKNALRNADVIISDLDHTDTMNSPAEDIAWKRIGVGMDLIDYANWAIRSGIELGLTNFSDKTKVRRWNVYENKFLKCKDIKFQRSDTFLTEDASKGIEKLITEKEVAKSLFYGVDKFYNEFKGKKIYLSRNLFPIVKAYADYLNFDGFEFDVKNKESVLNGLLCRSNLDYGKFWKRIVLKIDGDAENEMVNFARRRKKAGVLEDVLVIKRDVNMAADPRADVVVGGNDYGLLDVMKFPEEKYNGTITELGHLYLTKKSL